MSTVLDSTGKPTKPRLTDEQIYMALAALQTKLDHMGGQLFNCICLLEYTMDKVAMIKLPNGDPAIVLDADEFQTFFEGRLKEAQEEVQAYMASKVSKLAETT